MIGRKPPKPAQVALTQRAFDLLCLSAAFVLAVNASHLPWWLSAALAVILGSRWWQRRRHPGRVPQAIKLPLLTLLTLAIIAYYGNLFGRAPGTALGIGLLVLKLLETETLRDVRVGVGFACFTLMTALLFDQGMVSTLVVALGLVPALATLRALEPAQAPSGMARSFMPALGLLAAALPLALLAFVLVPRLGSPLWGAPGRDQARTGLSDRMSPGAFTELLTDDHPAMRVTFDGEPPPPDQRYFRAFVMSPSFNDTYDIPVDVMALLIADDEALLDFGLNFLRHTLFGEKFVEERPDAYEKRLARRRALAEQEKEAEFQQKMALEDDKYSGEH